VNLEIDHRRGNFTFLAGIAVGIKGTLSSVVIGCIPNTVVSFF